MNVGWIQQSVINNFKIFGRENKVRVAYLLCTHIDDFKIRKELSRRKIMDTMKIGINNLKTYVGVVLQGIGIVGQEKSCPF